MSLYGQFSAPVKRGSKPSKEEEEKQNYYVNMGYAIRTLREEFPGLFYRELNFDIYRFESDFFFLYLFIFNTIGLFGCWENIGKEEIVGKFTILLLHARFGF